jgi:Flp pilus assembly protein TadB
VPRAVGTGEDLGRVPERIHPTRGLAVVAFSIVTLFAGLFLLGALGAAAEGDWGVAVFALVFATAFLFALVSGIRRWRRGRLGLSAEQR